MDGYVKRTLGLVQLLIQSGRWRTQAHNQCAEYSQNKQSTGWLWPGWGGGGWGWTALTGGSSPSATDEYRMKGVEKVKYLSADEGAVDGSDSTVGVSLASLTELSLHLWWRLFVIRRWNCDFNFSCRRRAPSSVKTNPRMKPVPTGRYCKFCAVPQLASRDSSPPSLTLLLSFRTQEHPLFWEPAGVLQDAGWENREGKKRQQAEFCGFFFFNKTFWQNGG